MVYTVSLHAIISFSYLAKVSQCHGGKREFFVEAARELEASKATTGDFARASFFKGTGAKLAGSTQMTHRVALSVQVSLDQQNNSIKNCKLYFYFVHFIVNGGGWFGSSIFFEDDAMVMLLYWRKCLLLVGERKFYGT